MARRPDRTNAAPGASHALAPNTGAHPIFGTTDRTDGGMTERSLHGVLWINMRAAHVETLTVGTRESQ